MSNLIDLVDSLENKLSKLLHKYEQLKAQQEDLKRDLDQKDEVIAGLEYQLTTLHQDHESLKSANALLGSNEYKRVTKLKINSLIKEIDNCITQFSE
ncbi:hypothetical protein [Mesonia sp. K7]|uniref:hypothetical protein n=1 Tax=Mesonia sp. K7 TaxID=2218606 RepID=UPI000DA77C98|nr:hypothetical protein [Mesonia sp. K7]PZD77232.1 hypothetical protein DNG35_09160 [Mesonia sp. K7]